MRRFALICVCALGLTGSSAAQTRVAFLAVGDYGVGGSSELTTGRQMHKYETRNQAGMLVLLGDNDYTLSPSRFRANWQKSFSWARASGLRVSGTIGNHDYATNRGRYELGLLGMPSPFYTRTLGDIQLFFLDSNSVNAQQTAWLKGQLSRSSAVWKVAVFHHPPYTCGGHSGNSQVVASWVPLFEQYGVQLVLSGHDHNYQRFAPRNGVTYVVHGGGGAGLYTLHGCPSSYPARVRARFEHGFLYISATADQLNGSAVNTQGRVTDRFTLTP
jgi:3',5'-cyclic AMP phosphodiesterase CpdA